MTVSPRPDTELQVKNQPKKSARVKQRTMRLVQAHMKHLSASLIFLMSQYLVVAITSSKPYTIITFSRFLSVFRYTVIKIINKWRSETNEVHSRFLFPIIALPIADLCVLKVRALRFLYRCIYSSVSFIGS